MTIGKTLAMSFVYEFSLDNEAFHNGLGEDSHKRQGSPLASAWCRVAWECVLAEVVNRYASEDMLSKS